MDLLQVALIGPNGNRGIYRRIQNFRRREASIHARIEALPWAGHAESRLALRKYKKTTLLADITIGNPSAVPQMSRYVNRLEMGRAMWEPVTQLLHVR
jgi:hypothetical protein